jgi:hypothetical protein
VLYVAQLYSYDVSFYGWIYDQHDDPEVYGEAEFPIEFQDQNP